MPKNKLVSFRNFVENIMSGSFTSDSGSTLSSFDGRVHPQITLEFPTITKRGEVIRVEVQGANYRIQVSGGITILIPRKIYHVKYNRLPRAKTRNHPGDMITAVFYMYRDRNEKNYKLQGFQIDHTR